MTTQVSRNLTVTGDFRRVSYLDEAGQNRLLGVVKKENYDGEGSRMVFHASPNNSFASKKGLDTYKLGFGSTHLDFVDPADAMRILIDKGGVIEDQVALKGGLQMITNFSFPEAKFEDTLHFDEEIFQHNDVTRLINFGCSLSTSIVTGQMAAQYDFCWWRKLCQNGMRAKILGLPSLNFRHTEWEIGDVSEQVDAVLVDAEELHINGPVVAKIGAMNKGIRVLEKFVELNRMAGFNDDAEETEGEENAVAPIEMPTEYKLLATQFKVISPNMVKPRMLRMYIDTLHLMTRNHEDNHPVHAIDLACAWTSAVNMYRGLQSTDRGAYKALHATDGVINLTTTLSSLATLFEN